MSQTFDWFLTWIMFFFLIEIDDVLVIYCNSFVFLIDSHWDVGGVYLLHQSVCRDRLQLLDFYSEQNLDPKLLKIFG